MRNLKFIFLLLIIVSLFSCESAKKETEINKIKNMEAKLYSDSTKIVFSKASNDLVQEYSKFSSTYPDDTISADYLFKAGELSRAINQPKEAILFYDKITYSYPKYRKIGYCYFLMGFIYENQMNDLVNARKYYKLFVTKYPTHPLVKDTKILLENLGKPTDEIIKEFEAKEKQTKEKK